MWGFWMGATVALLVALMILCWREKFTTPDVYRPACGSRWLGRRTAECRGANEPPSIDITEHLPLGCCDGGKARLALLPP